ncbi:spore coat protein GerQ [Sporosarcina sp. ACRSL]|uniref:spore coat protein GerQ n=1 Tax=Sporosarcina sp. ACRSL TaxID=2918215 RepID=UPI001EF4120A|nr:spore coat protein GerQ [Sporosarcina sp. ACRSL]MCG7343511.1 spore coat protein GerQ [Sporosarcina sp. ACRSL]
MPQWNTGVYKSHCFFSPTEEKIVRKFKNERMENLVQYYYYPGYQHQQMQQMPATPPQIPAGGRPPSGREQSFIENILRLNRGKPGVFHFSFEHAIEPGKNTLAIPGMVEAAGRDHVILSSTAGKRYLIPMIYFDYAEFNEELSYFDQTPM